MKYDVVWYWVGGAERGDWKCYLTCPSSAIKGAVTFFRKQGYVAHPGKLTIGPPEGPPSRDQLDEVQDYWKRRAVGLGS